jgi:hypothetical protein
MEISALVATGMSNKAIAGRLEISEQSVKNMLQRAFAKTGASNRTELALLMLKVAAWCLRAISRCAGERWSPTGDGNWIRNIWLGFGPSRAPFPAARRITSKPLMSDLEGSVCAATIAKQSLYARDIIEIEPMPITV